MTNVLERHHHELVALCRKYQLKRLDAFGSAIHGDIDERTSDVDLLVELENLPHAERADAYLGFLTSVEVLLQRRVC